MACKITEEENAYEALCRRLWGKKNEMYYEVQELGELLNQNWKARASDEERSNRLRKAYRASQEVIRRMSKPLPIKSGGGALAWGLNNIGQEL